MTAVDLIAIDIDGTLLNPNRQLTPEVKAAIHEAKKAGIRVVLCTGRPSSGVNPFLKELRLEGEGDYAITFNGALVQKADTKEIMAHHTMNHQDYLTLLEEAEAAGIHYHVLDTQNLYTPNRDISKYTVVESYLTDTPLFYRAPEEMDPHAAYSKMMMIDEKDVLDAGIARLPETLWEDYTVLRSMPYFLEFLNKEASKGTALKDLGHLLGIPRDRLMAIGDSGNDTDLIEYAGIGVAMANAVDEVKDIANVFTASNAEDGVAKAIRKYALK